MYAKIAIFAYQKARIAQLVEHQFPKLKVAGSNPVSRSKIKDCFFSKFALWDSLRFGFSQLQ